MWEIQLQELRSSTKSFSGECERGARWPKVRTSKAVANHDLPSIAN